MHFYTFLYMSYFPYDGQNGTWSREEQWKGIQI
jgi:hypothetical protein